ncbi:type II toxin-antitoxin system death-on-curing family toxin [Sphingorhabdus sp. YGSMI21]|uniref:type II toxin-antitoxin system death-on-curing family toxin n=1 Tax=Sphingorhabdus sp. YGSMI21 TaxID=2077182 RepID=UPI000C1ED274|nr:type II toxin-antitoxin system death-on-curing family toxin [Sphingorhabdus sp. YGSMI21]ATW04107.1 type II toxin-antitoxin system death-on-curing family toxin [Sphingorhabdus sp. YGSMI21]
MTGDRIEPIWLGADIALAIHDRQLAEHGGPSGVRDQGLLESALAKPVNKWGYGENDLCALAAAYAFGVARNHPFTDGNKRTTWVLARTFLVLNNCQLLFDREEAIATVQSLAAGELTEEQLAKWFRDHIADD